MDRLGQGPGGRLPRDVGEHALHLVRGQAAQRDALEGGPSSEFGQRPRKRMRTVHLHVAVGADHEQVGRGDVPGEVREQVECALVGVVEVL